MCIGMGGGSLPLFLAHHFSSMHVEAVELDPVVIEAATHAMGFPLGRCSTALLHMLISGTCQRMLCTEGRWLGFILPSPLHRPNLAVHNQDGVAFLAQRAEAVADGRRPPIDLLFLDVFDGADEIPSAFTAPGTPSEHQRMLCWNGPHAIFCWAQCACMHVRRRLLMAGCCPTLSMASHVLSCISRRRVPQASGRCAAPCARNPRCQHA